MNDAFKLGDLTIEKIIDDPNADYWLMLPGGEGMGIKRKDLNKAILERWNVNF